MRITGLMVLLLLGLAGLAWGEPAPEDLSPLEWFAQTRSASADSDYSDRQAEPQAADFLETTEIPVEDGLGDSQITIEPDDGPSGSRISVDLGDGPGGGRVIIVPGQIPGEGQVIVLREDD
jgi:hypothetical protein